MPTVDNTDLDQQPCFVHYIFSDVWCQTIAALLLSQ